MFYRYIIIAFNYCNNNNRRIKKMAGKYEIDKNPQKPKQFTFDEGNIEKTRKDWKIWKEEFKFYLRLINAYKEYSEEQRALILINLMGRSAVEVMEEISFDNPDDKNDMDILLMKFDEKFDPPVSEALARFEFFSCKRKTNEDFKQFVANLKVYNYVYFKNHKFFTLIRFKHILNENI